MREIKEIYKKLENKEIKIIFLKRGNYSIIETIIKTNNLKLKYSFSITKINYKKLSINRLR